MKTDPIESLTVYEWRTNRQKVLNYIAGRIDIMLNDRGTGTFEINLEEMYKAAREEFRKGWPGVAERVEAAELRLADRAPKPNRFDGDSFGPCAERDGELG
jgi:hypothetical protein